MKKLLAILVLLAVTLPVYASTVLFVPQGGTGANTLTGCLTGHGTSAISGSGTCSTFAWLFTKQAGGEQATTTTLGFFNGFLSLASSTNLALFTTSNLLSTGSSTLQNFTASNSTTTQATTTNLSSGTICLSNDCRTVWPSSSTYTVTYPVVLTGTTLSLAFSTTTANSWSLLNAFNMSSTTVASFGNAYFGKTATSSFDGTGALFVVASTTLQNATSSNFNVSANAISLTSSNVYVNGSTTAAFSFGTSTLDATYKNYGSGSTTLLLTNYPEPRKLLGFYCVASSTTAFHFPALVRFKHDSTGNFTEANWCTTGGYTAVSTNASWTAFEGVDIEASSSANMIGRITITSVWQKLTP